MRYNARQRAVQVAGGSEWRTNANATRRDEIWNGLCCAVRRITSAPECTSVPSNWKNESTSAMEPGCGPYWTSRSSRSTHVWPSGQSGLPLSAHGGAGGKSIIIFTRAELECSLERCLTAVCNHHLLSVSVSNFVYFLDRMGSSCRRNTATVTISAVFVAFSLPLSSPLCSLRVCLSV